MIELIAKVGYRQTKQKDHNEYILIKLQFELEDYGCYFKDNQSANDVLKKAFVQSRFEFYHLDYV